MSRTRLNNMLRKAMAGQPEFLEALLTEPESKLAQSLFDAKQPSEQRAQLMCHVAQQHPELGQKMMKAALDLAGGNADAAAQQKLEELQKTLEALESGPLRAGRFVTMIDTAGQTPRAHLILHDGASAYSPVPDQKLAKELQCGDSVLMDAGAKAVLFRINAPSEIGDQATFERRVGERHVLVSMAHDEYRVIYAVQSLIDRIDKGRVKPGVKLLVNARQQFATDVLPVDDTLAHYRYVDPKPAPTNVAMGCPPRYVADFCRHLDIYLRRRELFDRWRIAASRFVLLAGVTGTGKTLSLYLLWQRMAQMIAEATGQDVADVPLKVFRLRPSEVYSKWLGESDQNLARFFKEVEQYASQPMTLADGTELPFTPCIALIEELDGVARSREMSDGLYSRILTTLLQYLDQSRPELRQLPIYFAATTNVVAQVDTAVVRRCGGRIERFRQLSRRAFISVLGKHLDELPMATRDDVDDQAELRRLATHDLANWLYAAGGRDEGVIEVTYANTQPETKHRRDFMTGALIARAVQDAAGEGCQREHGGDDDIALTVERLMEAIDEQVQSNADQLSKINIGSLIELREGGHVADVRRLRRPSIQPFQLGATA